MFFDTAGYHVSSYRSGAMPSPAFNRTFVLRNERAAPYADVIVGRETSRELRFRQNTAWRGPPSEARDAMTWRLRLVEG